MKKILLVLLITVITIFAVSAQEKFTEKQQKVQKIVIDMFQALADRDTIKLKSNCAPDILILENGSAWNLDTLTLRISQNTATDFKRINTIDFIDTKINGNVAWATYNNQADVTRNGKHVIIKWLETAILIKEDKFWKIKVLHSTLVSRS